MRRRPREKSTSEVNFRILCLLQRAERMPLMMAKWSMGASMGFQSMNQEKISISNPFIALALIPPSLVLIQCVLVLAAAAAVLLV